MKADRIIAANIIGWILLIFGKAFQSLGEPFLCVGFCFFASVCFIAAILILFFE